MVAIVSTKAGHFLVGADGGVFSFGDAKFPGSLSGVALNAPVVDAVRASGSANKLWLLAADGGIFTLNSEFWGSATTFSNPAPVGQPVVTGGNVAVPCPHTSTSVVVNASIGQNVAQLLAAADRAGLKLCGSGYRSAARQVELRKANCGTSYEAIYQMDPQACRPPTAIPGHSMHERGPAIDFTYNGSSVGSHSSAAYKWLAANASSFGYQRVSMSSWRKWGFDPNR